MNQSSIMQQRFQSWLVDSGEQAILRWIFRGTLIVTVAVLALDLADLQGPIASADTAASPAEIREESPALNLPNVLPSILAPLLPGGDKRLVMLPEPDGALARPMTFELVAGGKLMATGTITPGISAIFAAEVGRHGRYLPWPLVRMTQSPARIGEATGMSPPSLRDQSARPVLKS